TWADRMRQRLDSALTGSSRGVRVELSFDRRTLSALLDIVPPGVDEIFATSKLLELVEGHDQIVIDMAPTGHALELLSMPERMLTWTRLMLKSLAAHRTLPLAQEIAVDLATAGQQVRQLRAMLQDRKRCRAMVVTTAEPVPLVQAAFLLG